MLLVVVLFCFLLLSLLCIVFPRVVSTEMGRKQASEWNASFVESSAKQNEVSDHFVCVEPSELKEQLHMIIQRRLDVSLLYITADKK